MRALVNVASLRCTILRPQPYLLLIASLILGSSVSSVWAQDNYEIQVYGSETVPRGVTMLELHNNFTA